MMVQELIAGLVVLAAALYLADKMFGLFKLFGWRRARKVPPVLLGSRLAKGLKNAPSRQKGDYRSGIPRT